MPPQCGEGRLDVTSPRDAIDEISGLLHGMPVYLAGSCVSAEVYGKQEFGDVDLFVPTQQVLISTVQSLLNHGYTPDDRFERVWYRWLRYGLKGFHTNSMRLHSLKDTPVNVVYKIVDGHPTTSLSQVLESFDFGLLGAGLDLESMQWRDLRPYLFPGLDVDGPLPMMPNKRGNWREGFLSQYNGIREAARYAKYVNYGYDMSEVSEDLVHGYRQAASYHATSFDSDKVTLSEIYTAIADRIEAHEIDELTEAYKVIDYKDELELILEKLE
jgi:hypothetical protein